MELINPKDRLPDDGEYVLAYFGNQPWGDDNDVKGNRFWKVVRIQKGLSKKDRDLLPTSDPRKTCYHASDEDSNNRVPYNWEEFGPSSFFGQECMFWCELPDVSKYQAHENHDRKLKETYKYFAEQLKPMLDDL